MVQLSSKKKLPSAFGFHWTQDSQFASCESLQLVCQKVGSTIWKLMLDNNLILTVYKKKTILQASYLIVFWLPLPTWTSWILFKFLVKQQEKCIWTLECKYKACSHRSIDSHLVRGWQLLCKMWIIFAKWIYQRSCKTNWQSLTSLLTNMRRTRWIR